MALLALIGSVVAAFPARPLGASLTPPVAVADAYDATEGQQLSVGAPGVLGNDIDLEGDTLTANLVSDVVSGSLNLQSDGSFTYTPVGNFNGDVSFTYTANDGTSDSVLAATVTIHVANVNDPPTVSDRSLSVQEGGTLIFALTANDPDDDASTLTYAIDNDVSHGSLNCGSSGACTYTPASNYSGPDSFTYHAEDPHGAASPTSATASITVTAVNDPPTATGQAVSTTEDTPVDIQLHGTDTDDGAGSLSFQIANDPDHGTVDCTSGGACSYTPAANYHGADAFTFRAEDPHGALSTNAATVSITVSSVNDPPVAVNSSISTLEGDAKTFTVAATDPDNTTGQLTFAVGTQPTHGLASCTGAGSCTYTPVAGYVGGDSFTFTVHDPSNASDTGTVSVTVGANNHAPVASNAIVSVQENVAKNFALAATDADNDALSYAIITQPTHGTLTCTGAGACTFTPTTDYVGTDSFTFQATDGTSTSNLATVSVTIAHVNTPPVATSQAVTTAEDTALPITLGAVDVDADTLTFKIDTQPLHGTLSAGATVGTYSYKPDANYNGADSFTFEANDGTAASNVATISITITPVNDAPKAKNYTFSTGFNQTLSIAAPGVLTGATDVENDALTAVPFRQPDHGTLTLKTSGGFVYAPDPQFKGSDSFQYRAQDSNGAFSSPASVTIGVQVEAGTGPVDFVGTNAPEERGFLSSEPRGLHADLGGGGDTYDVPFGALHGLVQIDDSGRNGTDTLNVFGQTGNDNITITGSRVRHNGERIDYRGVEALALDAQRGNDQVTVGGAPFPGLKRLVIDGGDGDDELVVNAGKHAAQIVGDSIVVPGWPSFSYHGFERVTVNSSVSGTRRLSSDGYWLLASDGGVFTFGDARFYGSTGHLHLQAPIIQMIPTPSGHGYWLLASDGGVFTFGDARFYGSTGHLHLQAPIIQMIATPTGHGYWLLASDGGVFTFGDAHFYGSTGGMALRSRVVQMVATRSGHGYWLRASDGGIFTFGDAHFYGSTGSLALTAPITQMVPAPAGNGYWLLSSNGQVFGFGSAHYYGTTSTQSVSAPPIQLVPTPSGRGYWVAHNDGSVFPFGDAKYYGSMLGRRVSARVVQMLATPTGHGYWLLGLDGGIFTFGDARFHGSTGSLHLQRPITRMIVAGL